VPKICRISIAAKATTEQRISLRRILYNAMALWRWITGLEEFGRFDVKRRRELT
jgi:hypothetical protein